MKLEDTYEISNKLIVDFMSLIEYTKEKHNLNYDYFWGDYCENDRTIFNGKIEEGRWALEKFYNMLQHSNSNISEFASKMYDELNEIYGRYEITGAPEIEIMVRYSW